MFFEWVGQHGTSVIVACIMHSTLLYLLFSLCEIYLTGVVQLSRSGSKIWLYQLRITPSVT